MIAKREFVKVGIAASMLGGTIDLRAAAINRAYPVLAKESHISDLFWTLDSEKQGLLAASDAFLKGAKGGYIHHSAGLTSPEALTQDHLSVSSQVRRVFSGGCHPAITMSNGTTILGASCFRDGQTKAFILTRSRNSIAAVGLLHNNSGRHGFKDFLRSRTQSGFVQADRGKPIPRTRANYRDKSIRVDGFWTLSLFCKEQDSKDGVLKEAIVQHVKSLYLESNLALNPKTRTYKFFFESVQV
jgi:hypothetical protein